MSKQSRTKSLQEVHASVDTTGKSTWRRLLSFLGPAYLVCVGYMDPGNWATDIAGGSAYGYTLIWVLLMSNIMALVLQSLAARMGIVAGLDLAQASRLMYPPWATFLLWILAEIAIAATDLAEVIGMAIGLNLLFDLPLLWCVGITVFDTFLLLYLQNLGMRKMEVFILGLVSIIGGSFLVEMYFAKPALADIATGFVPSLPDETALFIAIGIIGATVMPHNLYLHSALVQTRKIDPSTKGVWQAIKYNFFDSAIALNLAFFVNAAILILAASVFYKAGFHEISEIDQAHKLLEPLMGEKLAPILFALALVAAGQSSTLTGTLSGQIVMEGYLNLRMQAWLRRLITRLLAIIPAVIAIVWFGNDSLGQLLVLSQVILSLQLGFAIIPLIHFTSGKAEMGEFAIGNKLKIAAWTITIIIVSLNVRLVLNELSNVLNHPSAGSLSKSFLVLFAAATAVFLLYVMLKPLFRHKKSGKFKGLHGKLPSVSFEPKSRFKKIAIAVDFSENDTLAIAEATRQGGTACTYLLIHCLETAGARWMGGEVEDKEHENDLLHLKAYEDELKKHGFDTTTALGFGNPKTVIPYETEQFNADLLVMAEHGHGFVKDLFLGTTIDTVRHRIKIPLLIVK